jgi:hypothetical protein
MGTRDRVAALAIILCCEISHGAEYDLKTITAVMDAYEKQTDSIKLKYSYTTFPVDKDGNREFVKGYFAQKPSEGCVLLDEVQQVGKTWENDKEGTGVARAYNGEVTRYLDHEQNEHGYHMAALYKDHNPKWYLSKENPYYRVWGNNYKNKFKDRLSDPNAMATIEGEEIVDGMQAVKIHFLIKEALGVLDCHLWLLPEKHYLPVKWINYKPDGGRLQEMHWSEFKQFAGGIWYPMNIEMYLKDVEAPVVFRIEEMDTSALSKQDFEFTFPAFTHVTDHIAGTSYLTTPTMEQSGIEGSPEESPLSGEQKEKILDKYLESGKATNKKAEDAKNPGAKVLSRSDLGCKSHAVVCGTAVLVAVLAGIGAVCIFRRRRRT